MPLPKPALLCRPAGFLRLWDTAGDPWNATIGTGNVLNELTLHWNANMASQKRTVVYMARWGGAAAGIGCSMGGRQ